MPTTILTGLPRSGTTLVCALLNQLPDAVALVEPMGFGDTRDPGQSIAEIEAFAAQSRRRALQDGMMLTKAYAGTVPGDTMAPAGTAGGLRREIAAISLIPIGKELSKDFNLFIKNPGWFTALAEPLCARYPVFAFVRNPLAVLASWQCVDIPPHYGRASGAEQFDRALSSRLDQVSDDIERQVELMSWFLQVYARLGTARVLRFEDLIAEPAGTLARLHRRSGEIRYPIEQRTIEERYPNVDLARLAAALRRALPLIRPLYPDFEDTLDRHAPRSRVRTG